MCCFDVGRLIIISHLPNLSLDLVQRENQLKKTNSKQQKINLQWLRVAICAYTGTELQVTSGRGMGVRYAPLL